MSFTFEKPFPEPFKKSIYAFIEPLVNDSVTFDVITKSSFSVDCNLKLAALSGLVESNSA